MMKTRVAIFLAVCCSSTVFAQKTSIDWDAKPVVHTVKPKFAKESAVILSDVRLHQYAQDGKNGLVVNITNKRLIKVNDDKGVEMYNKVYIPLAANAEMVEIKARTIQPNGKVVDLPASKILDVEEEGRKYKKFALEGVEKGSEIEYLYRVKKNLYFFGLETFQSGAAPYEKAEFILAVPEHLVFSVKGYNGIKVSEDTVIDEQRIITATGQDIIVLEDEKYSTKDQYLQNVQYKLSYNLGKDKNVRLFTWNELAKNVYSNYSDFSEKELKAVESFLKKANISSSASEEEKIIIALEDYIKTNINSDEEGIGEDADKIEKIVKSNIASNEGITRLFVACMEKLNIKYQMVFPSKRDDYPLDEAFENYRLIEEMIFYFPNTGNYLEPTGQTDRYPYIEPYWAGTTGLFLKGTTIGTFKTALASFDSIAMQPYEKSASNMEVKLQFNETMDSLVLHSKQILMGYSATYYRPAFNFLPQDRKDEFTKSVVNSVAKSDNIRNIKLQNTGMTDGAQNKPLIIEADITSAEIMEQAGKKILVKLGEVIGPQEQMYQEKPRQLPIVIQYPHALDRDIYFTIPDGYQIKNLNDLNINITDKEKTMGFESSYTLKGNELKVLVHEYYKSLNYPLNMFEEFKKVINASADFNKVVLVLEKK